MLQTTNLHFNEDNLNWILVATERYMILHPDCHEKIKEAHKVLNEIWYKLKIDEEYYISEEL